LTVAVTGAGYGQDNVPPFKVTIQDEQAVAVEQILPVDPVRRIQFAPQGLTPSVRSENNETLHLSHYATPHVDGQIGFVGNAEYTHRPLGKGKDSKERDGVTSRYVYNNGLRLTVTMSVVATRPADKAAKRQRDAVFTHYLVENTGTKPRKFGLRIFMDTYVINNDGCLFAAPTMPGKILNGVVLKGKEFPPYVQLLHQPNLMNPGYVAHLTFELGSKFEKPDRIVLTRLAASAPWDVVAMQAGDSALAFFWEPMEIKPGGKREFGYGYGKGIVPNPESEGQVEMVMGGSFAPGKVFSITARVIDPATGQSLQLELPPGMELLEGKETQAVPALSADEGFSLVYWRARVLRPGEFSVRIHSSTGVTSGKRITMTKS